MSSAVSFALAGIALVVSYFVVLRRLIPSRLDPASAPRSAFKLVEVPGFAAGPVGSRGIDIVFIHGLGSNPDTTWVGNGPDGAKHWIRDFLPADVDDELRTHVRVYLYNHDTYWKRDAIEQRLDGLANNLLSELKTRFCQISKDSARGLVLVAHSYGGLIAKRTLVKASLPGSGCQEIFHRTKGILFLGTPHQGIKLSSFARFLALLSRPLGSNPAIFEGLEFASLKLSDLHHDFVKSSFDAPVVNFFELRASTLVALGWIRWTIFLVPEWCAVYDGPNTERIGLNADHYELNKFGQRSTEYEQIRDKLLWVINNCLGNFFDSHFSVPLVQVTHYTARPTLSAEIEEKARKPNSIGRIAHVVAIIGIGGAGKTQLALNFIESTGRKFNYIFWIDCRDIGSIKAGYERCARELNLPFQEGESVVRLRDSSAVQSVQRWLRDRDNMQPEWLLVLDNADDLGTDLVHSIPLGDRGTVIITSQDNDIVRICNEKLGYCEIVRVSALEVSEAVELLLRRTGLSKDAAGSGILIRCRQISELLENLALAVDLAGAYIFDVFDTDPHGSEKCRVECAINQSLESYQHHLNEVVEQSSSQTLGSYEKSLKTVWDLSLHKVEMSYPGASELLSLMSFLDSNNVQPELLRLSSDGLRLQRTSFDLSHQKEAAKSDLLHTGFDNQVSDNEPTVTLITHSQMQYLPRWFQSMMFQKENGGWDDFAFYRAIQGLLRFSLIRPVAVPLEGYNIHSLVRARACQRHLDQNWLLILRLMLAGAYESVEDRNHSFRRPLGLHILRYFDAFGDLRAEVGRDDQTLYYRLAQSVFDMGNVREAEKILSHVVSVRTELLGFEHAQTLRAVASLSTSYDRQSFREKCEDLLTRAITASNGALGKTHEVTIDLIRRLASNLWLQGRLREAEDVAEPLLETLSQSYADNHELSMTVLGTLVCIYNAQNRYDEALCLSLKLGKLREENSRADEPKAIANKVNICEAYFELGRLEECETLVNETLITSKRILGDTHIYTLALTFTLVELYQQRNQPEAKDLAEKLVRLKETAYGIDHENTFMACRLSSRVYNDLGLLSEAETLAEKLVDRGKKVYGENSGVYFLSVGNLAYILRQQYRAEAETLAVYAMEGSKTALGESHRATIRNIEMLGPLRKAKWR